MQAFITQLMRAGVIAILAIAGLAGNAQMAAANRTLQTTTPLFTEETAFTAPNNSWSYWFEVKPGMQLVAPCWLSLAYTCSDTMLAGKGSLTVLLNDIPLASRVVPTTAGAAMPWVIQLPVAQVKSGFNEIRLTSRQHSSLELCRDVENSANWLHWGQNSVIHFTRRQLARYPLSCYPFPYLDSLSGDPVASDWALPASADADDIAAMLNVASDWGHRLPTRGLALSVKSGRIAGTSRHQVYFGTLPHWQAPTASSVPAAAGWLWSGASGGRERLIVSGADSAGLQKATAVLSHPDLLQQIDAYQLTQSTDPPEVVTTPEERLGHFTLADLGYPKALISGAFRQRLRLQIHRPLHTDLGRESFFEIHFSHAASLLGQSLLTVLVDNHPIGSVRLTDENAINGKIMLRLPIDALQHNGWQIDIVCFHDIGRVDCAKRYDDIAWTVIHGDSFFALMPGKIPGMPYLEHFPYCTSMTGRVNLPLICWLPEHPTDQQLTAAAVIAARAGQTNRCSLTWHVVLGKVQPVMFQGATVVLMLGAMDDADRLVSLRHRLDVWPTANGQFEIAHDAPVIPDALQHGAVVQACNSPWNNTGILYSVLATDDRALARLCRQLTQPAVWATVTGNIALCTATGRILSVDSVPARLRVGLMENERERYTWPMYLLMGLLFLGILIWIFKYFSLFFRKRQIAAAKKGRYRPDAGAPVKDETT